MLLVEVKSIRQMRIVREAVNQLFRYKSGFTEALGAQSGLIRARQFASGFQKAKTGS
jgi:hypothetical protein